jgi:hypothetical protein
MVVMDPNREQLAAAKTNKFTIVLPDGSPGHINPNAEPAEIWTALRNWRRVSLKPEHRQVF